MRQRQGAGRLLVVSALPGEQAALRRRWGAGRGALVEARDNLYFGVTGDGAERARAGLHRFIQMTRPHRILVVGLGGGLSPNLASESLVVGSAIIHLDGESDDLAAAPEVSAEVATLVSARSLVATAAEKQALWSAVGCPSPAVVDLETSAYRQAAGQLPLSVFRVVSDAANEDLPPEILRSTDAQGSVRPWAVALRAVLRPASWPALTRLKGRLDRASERLAHELEVILAEGS